MKTKKKLNLKVSLVTISAILIAIVMVLSGIGIYLNLKPKERLVKVNPLDFSFDSWDGKTIDTINYNEDYAGRGLKTKTINSAASFVHFINEVNSGKIYDDYTIYLNSNIDMKGYEISPIGNAMFKFAGVFDGGHYSILNAKVKGNSLFANTNNATIKNVGLYNVEFLSESSNNALVGVAENTNIENIYVRLGNGNLVNEFISNNGTHEIKNSFVDNSSNGLVGKIDTNNSQENEVAISNCYFTNGDTAIVEIVEGSFVNTENKVIKATNKSQFADWSYSSDYSTSVEWCDYDYLPNTTKLDFIYPLQAGFVKVFLTGSCYEAVMVDKSGRVVDATNMSEAFKEAEKSTMAEINLVVEKIFMEAQATAQNNSIIQVNAVKDTTIVRGENNNESMFVAAGSAKITLGNEIQEAGVATASGRTSLPTLTIDGNRSAVEKSGEESGAVVVSYGAEVEIKENVVIKNNVNNNIKYGGAVLLFNTAVKSTINGTFENCYAENGGGAVCVVGTTVNSLGSAYNCSTKGKGGAAYLAMELPQEETQAMRTLYGKGLNVQPMNTINQQQTVEAGTDISTVDTYENCSSSSSGGAICCDGALTISGAPTFKNCSSSIFGGAIYAESGFVTISGNPIFENNNASGGGAIYNDGMPIEITGNPIFTNNTAGCTGGALDVGMTIISGSPEFVGNKQTQTGIPDFGGGAICATSLTIKSTSKAKFEDNTSAVSGGAIRSNGLTTIEGEAIFQSHSGVAIYADFLTISGDAVFMSNGTAIKTKELTISGDAEFKGNTLAISAENIDISGDAVFEHNAASLNDYGDWNEDETEWVPNYQYDPTGEPAIICVETVNISGDAKFKNGGYIEAGTVIIEETSEAEFIGNHCHLEGSLGFSYAGGGAIKAGVVEIKGDALFSRNSALGYYGGAIWAKNKVTISGDAIFIYNSSGDYCGGAIYCAVDVEISGDAQFVGNNNYGTSGSAIYASGTISISGNPIFEGNETSEDWGSMAGGSISSTTVAISGSPIFRNNRSHYGGAINASGNVIISGNPIFENNYAEYNGGAIYSRNVLISDTPMTYLDESFDTGLSHTWGYGDSIETTLMFGEINQVIFKDSADYLTVYTDNNNQLNVSVNFAGGEVSLMSDKNIPTGISLKLEMKIYLGETPEGELVPVQRIDVKVYDLVTGGEYFSDHLNSIIGQQDAILFSNILLGTNIWLGEFKFTNSTGTHIFNEQPQTTSTGKVVFDGNAANLTGGFGGAIYANGNVTVANRDVDFLNNSAAPAGAINANNVLLAGNTNFIGNESNYYLIYANNTKIYGTANFIGNSVADPRSSLLQNNVTLSGDILFKNNVTRGSGAIDATTLDIKSGKVVFKDNKGYFSINNGADFTAGAFNATNLYVRENAEVILQNNYLDIDDNDSSDNNSQIRVSGNIYLYAPITDLSTNGVPAIYLSANQYINVYFEYDETNPISVYKESLALMSAQDDVSSAPSANKLIFIPTDGSWYRYDSGEEVIPCHAFHVVNADDCSDEYLTVLNGGGNYYGVVVNNINPLYNYSGYSINPTDVTLYVGQTVDVKLKCWAPQSGYEFSLSGYAFSDPDTNVCEILLQGGAGSLEGESRWAEGKETFVGLNPGTVEFTFLFSYCDINGDLCEEYPTITITVLPLEAEIAVENEKIWLEDYSSGEFITQNITIDSNLEYGYITVKSSNLSVVEPYEHKDLIWDELSKVAVADSYNILLYTGDEGAATITVDYYLDANSTTPVATKTFDVVLGSINVDVSIGTNNVVFGGESNPISIKLAGSAESYYVQIDYGTDEDSASGDFCFNKTQLSSGVWHSNSFYGFGGDSLTVRVYNERSGNYDLIFEKTYNYILTSSTQVVWNDSIESNVVTYNGYMQEVLPGNYDELAEIVYENRNEGEFVFTFTGHQQTEAGTYTAYISLEGTSYYWRDGTQGPKPYTYTIQPAKLATPSGLLLGGQVQEMVLSWNGVGGASDYEFQIIVNDQVVQTESFPGNYWCGSWPTLAGEVRVRMRAISANANYVTSDWVTSNSVHIISVQLNFDEGFDWWGGYDQKYVLMNGGSESGLIGFKENYIFDRYETDSANVSVSVDFDEGDPDTDEDDRTYVTITANYIMGDYNAVINFYTKYNGYHVQVAVNNDEYGEVTLDDVLVPTGTAITTDGSKLFVGDHEIYAIPVADTVEYSYKFTGWSGVVSNVTRELMIVANFERTINQYTINFEAGGINDADDYVTFSHSSITVPYGTQVQFIDNVILFGSTVVVADVYEYHDAGRYTYFAGWSGKINNFVEGHTTLYAEIAWAQEPHITITIQTNNAEFGLVDEEASHSIEVENGCVVSVEGYLIINSDYYSAQAAQATDHYEFRFVGWEHECEIYSSDEYATLNAYDGMVITAVFERVGKEFTVSISSNNTDYGNVVTSVITAHYGDEIRVINNMIIVGNSSAVAVAADRTAQYEYAFADWKMADGSAVGNSVTGNMSIKANFTRTERTYTVTLVANDDNKGYVQSEEYDEYNAEYYSNTITVNYGTFIKVQDYKIIVGAMAYKAIPKDGYTFEKWSGVVGSVNGNITITAVFSTEGDWAVVRFVANTYVETSVNGNTIYDVVPELYLHVGTKIDDVEDRFEGSPEIEINGVRYLFNGDTDQCGHVDLAISGLVDTLTSSITIKIESLMCLLIINFNVYNANDEEIEYREICQYVHKDSVLDVNTHGTFISVDDVSISWEGAQLYSFSICGEDIPVGSVLINDFVEKYGDYITADLFVKLTVS